LSEVPDLLAGIERFRDVELAGRGAMGAVFRAVDTELGATVAIKTILDAGPDWIYRLKQEFRSLRGLVHRNLVQLYDLVVQEGSCFFTMEYIDGVDFVESVRGSGDRSLREIVERLRASAPQLVEGMRALHAAGHLHRDIKPGNIKVDMAGRVVLLDYDLVSPLERSLPMDFASAAFAGTFAYMAPEQLLGLTSGPAADRYAAGVVLYESLTGKLPLDDRALIMRQREIVPVRDRVPDAPGWLAELIEALLSTDPGARPTDEEILACFAAERAPAANALARVAESHLPVGREAELAQLAALRRAGGSATVAVHGISGVGKTELARAFLESLSADPVPLVLSGRCNPQESVPYEALDPIVDGLSRHLLARAGPLPELAAREATAAIKLFPVLARVPALSGAAAGVELLDVVERRRLGTRALRELLRAATPEGGLILWMDDVQWSDADSAALLGELLRPPNAPPLLLLLTCRSEDRAEIALFSVLAELSAQFPELAVGEIELRPLDAQYATQLAGQLSGGSPLPRDQIDAIVAESHGSPFLIHEMVRFLQGRERREIHPGERVDLSNVVAARLAELDPDEHRLLELVSLCGQATERGLLLRAAGLGSQGRRLIARLESRSLVRVQVARGEHAVQTYHDRIREAISGELAEDRRVQLHGDLAQVFELSGRVEPDVLAYHFHGAQRLVEAAGHAIAAADHAADALAFARAARLYRSAREWDPRTPDHARRLQTREAECAANAANLAEAGRLYLAASSDAPQLEALELRRRASEHLLAGGSVEDGTAALASLLDDLGLSYPRTARSAAFGCLRVLALIWLRGLTRRGARRVDAEETIRIDTCFGAGKTLVNMDALRGSYFWTVGLSRSLAAGDRYRTTRSLGVVGAMMTLFGGPLSGPGHRMMKRAGELATEIGAPELLGTLAVAEGQELMLHGHWRRAHERSSEGVRLLSERCQGYAFECNIGRGQVLRSLQEIGENAPLISELAQQYYEAAISAANIYTETAAMQHMSYAAMTRDDLDGARRFARRGVELWNRGSFHIQHLYNLRALAMCDLYEGRPQASHQRLHEIRSALRESNLMQVPLVRVDVHQLAGKLGLAMACGDRANREELLRSCEQSARRLDREKQSHARAHAHLLRAGVAILRGRAPSALAHLDRAIEVCQEDEMVLRGACALLCKGDLLGGDEGRECIARAEKRIEEIGIAEPRRWSAMYALGFDVTERRRTA
jgi:eukaryotic-like serine/threonine-protein kinase